MATINTDGTNFVSTVPGTERNITEVDRQVPAGSGVAMGTTLNDFNEVTKNDLVKADHLLKAANVLYYLRNHYHSFYDDYTAVCQCVCQCLCNRGTL